MPRYATYHPQDANNILRYTIYLLQYVSQLLYYAGDLSRHIRKLTRYTDSLPYMIVNGQRTKVLCHNMLLF